MGLDLGIGEIFGALGAVSSVVGTLTKASADTSAATAQAQEATYQAQVAQNNQTIANQNAAYAARSGQSAITQTQLQERSKIGGVAAALAANGIDINTGSPADVRAAQEGVGQVDVQNTAQKALLDVYGFKTQASNYQAQSGLYTLESQNAVKAGLLNSSADLFSGASALASKWSSWQTTTGPGTTNAYSFTDPVTGL